MERESEFMSDIEKEKIIAFNSDPILVHAVKKILLKTIYGNGVLKVGKQPEPLKNGALGLAFLALAGRAIVTNEQLGEDLRALAHGVNLLEAGFNELEKFKKEPADEVKSDVNIAE